MIIFDIRLPNTNNAEFMTAQKPVPASVSLALFKSVLWRIREHIRVSVPVIAVHFYDHLNVWNKEITNQIAYNGLRDVVDLGIVKKFCHNLFRTANKRSSAGIVSIQALVVALHRAEPYTLLNPALGSIKHFAALNTGNISSFLSVLSPSEIGTFIRTIFLTIQSAGRKNLSAYQAWAFWMPSRSNAFTRLGTVFPPALSDIRRGGLCVKLFSASRAENKNASPSLRYFGGLVPSPSAALNRTEALSVVPALVPELSAAPFAYFGE